MLEITEQVKKTKESQERILEIEKTIESLGHEKKKLEKDKEELHWQSYKFVHDEATKEELLQFFEERKLLKLVGCSGEMGRIASIFDVARSVLREKYKARVDY